MVTVKHVIKAMEATAPDFPVQCWWDDTLTNKIINYGVAMGWLLRPSTTQVEWTQEGLLAAKRGKGTHISFLKCACCGATAPSLKQWHDQDKGFGLCRNCNISLTAKYGEVYVRATYGQAGIHHSVDISLNGGEHTKQLIIVDEDAYVPEEVFTALETTINNADNCLDAKPLSVQDAVTAMVGLVGMFTKEPVGVGLWEGAITGKLSGQTYGDKHIAVFTEDTLVAPFGPHGDAESEAMAVLFLIASKNADRIDKAFTETIYFLEQLARGEYAGADPVAVQDRAKSVLSWIKDLP